MPKEPIKTMKEKLSTVLEGLKESTNIAELCRRHGISQTSFYKWRDKFLEGGKSLPGRYGCWNDSHRGREGQDRSVETSDWPAGSQDPGVKKVLHDQASRESVKASSHTSQPVVGHRRDEVLYPAHRWALPGCCHRLVYQTGLGIHLGLEAQDGALA